MSEQKKTTDNCPVCGRWARKSETITKTTDARTGERTTRGSVSYNCVGDDPEHEATWHIKTETETTT